MPKQVDHTARRRAIADALWRVVAREGFEGVSLRQVAAEAGVSMGMVQHYFRTKEQMLLFALDTMEERAGARFAAELARLPDPPPPRAAVRAFLVQLLPLDEARREEGHSLYALLAGGLRHGGLGQRLRIGMGQLREFITGQVVAAGKVTSDPEVAAATLMALTDGLAAHVLGGFLAPEAAEAALDAQLETVFGPETSP
ncbi:MAG: TetR/AcrR family transcriptional regulator [Pseudonocardiaceae bacterium]